MCQISPNFPDNIKRGIDIGQFNISLLFSYFHIRQEGNLKRYPTPYPDELKNMVKTAQSVAHRLREDESSDESGKPHERNHIGVQDVGVKVSPKNWLLCEINNEEVVPFSVLRF